MFNRFFFSSCLYWGLEFFRYLVVDSLDFNLKPGAAHDPTEDKFALEPYALSALSKEKNASDVDLNCNNILLKDLRSAWDQSEDKLVVELYPLSAKPMNQGCQLVFECQKCTSDRSAVTLWGWPPTKTATEHLIIILLSIHMVSYFKNDMGKRL